MSDGSQDPWRSLASELGVDPDTAPPPPPAPPSTPVPPAFLPPSVEPEPKKTHSDWTALAGELGIEVPTEPEAPITRNDPVAELLGWPQSSPQPEPQEDEARGARDFDEREPWDRDEVQERWGEYERDEPVGDFESETRPATRGEAGERESPGERGRRGRRGRGRRERGESRRPRDRDRRPVAGEYERDESRSEESREPGDTLAEFGVEEDRSEGADAEGELRGKRRRRRGRRRGRGEERAPAAHRPEKDELMEEEVTVGSAFDEPDIILFGEAAEEDVAEDLASEDELVEVGVSDDDDLMEGRRRRGKSSVRDILTWKEAIGFIIGTNMQERSRNPRSSRNGGRGRRGGPRRERP